MLIRKGIFNYSSLASHAGPLATVSDVVLENCRFPAFLGALTSLALLGYHITEKSESLREITETPLLTFRAGYSNRVIYDLFEDLGPEGMAPNTSHPIQNGSKS